MKVTAAKMQDFHSFSSKKGSIAHKSCRIAGLCNDREQNWKILCIFASIVDLIEEISKQMGKKINRIINQQLRFQVYHAGLGILVYLLNSNQRIREEIKRNWDQMLNCRSVIKGGCSSGIG